MRVGQGESWVTLVLNDVSAWEALVLAASLKRQMTLRKVTAIIHGRSVSEQMQLLLRNNFDFVETLENASAVYSGEEFNEQKSFKKYLWSLLIWKKCVFISPNFVVLESIDYLFDLHDFSAPQVEVGGQRTMNLDLFVFKPEREIFHLLSAAKSRTVSGDDGIVKHFWKSWTTSQERKIPNEVILFLTQTHLHLHCPTPKIISFEDQPWIQNSQPNREVKYSTQWLQIFAENVLPQLRSAELYSFFQESLPGMQIEAISRPMTSDREANDLQDAIAIVGMSCRFPGANSVEEYWNLMMEGRCAIQKFPKWGRTFEIPGIQSLTAGFLSCAVDEFDAKFFGISPREAPLIDPQQRLLLSSIWESLEDAGLDGSLLKESPTGVFVGVLTQDYDRMLPRNGYIGNEYHHRFLGNAISATVGRISHFMGFTGPNMALESGDSSSLGALHLACQSLRNGECNLAISGGVNLVLIPRYYNSPILSEDTRLKSVQQRENGFVSGEGVATIVLKRYSDAIRDGDHIRAIIRGSAVGNDDGRTTIGATAQAQVYQEALCNARVRPEDVSYIETHGTGCTEADAIEMTALSQVYSANRNQPLLIGSVKPNIGNGESTAGIGSIIRLILAMEKRMIPKNLHSENSKLRLVKIPLEIPISSTPWPGSRFGATTAISLTGTLVHAVLQSVPQNHKPIAIQQAEGSRPELILISAKTPEALEAQYKNYSEFCRRNANESLSNIAFATNLCRTHFQHRLAIVARDTKDLIHKLDSKDFIGGKIAGNSKPPSVGFLFTGQASQYFGMAKDLYVLFPAFRDTINYCAEIYSRLCALSLHVILWEDESLLQKTEYAQPAIFCIQIALVKLWRHFGIRPAVVVGHSLGEYGAAVAAEVISIEDGLRLVIARSQLVSKLGPGQMLAINSTLAEVEYLLAELNMRDMIDIAAVNSPTQIVLSGSSDEIEAFETACITKEIKTTRLASGHAFHSRHVDDILDEFGLIAQSITYNEPICTYISSTLGRPMTPEDFRAEYWQCHLRDTVQFSRAVELLTRTTQTLIEIGPQPVLLGLARANNLSQEVVYCPSLRRAEKPWYTFYSSLAKLHVTGVQISWVNHFGRRNKNLKLPLYPFQRQHFWFVLKDYTDEEDDKERDGIYLNSVRIHPILGYKIRTPGKLLFSQSKLLKELPYLSDCTVANTPFLTPGAVIELFLAAANQNRPQSTANADSILCLRNLEFQDYLRLVSDQQTVQTCVENRTYAEEPNQNRRIALYTEVEPMQWKILACADTSYEIGNEGTSFDWLRQFDELKLDTKMSISALYESAHETEIRFGNKYRRIMGAWKLRNGAIVTKLFNLVQDPQIIGNKLDSYICFPTILDAMIQSYRLMENGGICLPKKIQKITWFKREANTSELMVYAHVDEAHLVTWSGQLIGSFHGLEFMAQSTNICEAKLPIEYIGKQEPSTLDTSHIQMPLDNVDERLHILAEIIARPIAPGEDVVERNVEMAEKLEIFEALTQNHTQSFAEKLETLLKQTLRLPACETLDLDQNFTEIGIDSLMGLEIGSKIQQLIPDRRISTTIVQEFPTMRSLLANLVNQE